MYPNHDIARLVNLLLPGCALHLQDYKSLKVLACIHIPTSLSSSSVPNIMHCGLFKIRGTDSLIASCEVKHFGVILR